MFVIGDEIGNFWTGKEFNAFECNARVFYSWEQAYKYGHEQYTQGAFECVDDCAYIYDQDGQAWDLVTGQAY